MSAANNRIEWVDIAKGIAILWVVALHIGLFGAGSKFEDFVFTTWCMPFFFTISGLFLSHSDDFGTFFKKRVNNLLVPLCFFVFLTNALFWVAGDLLGGTEKGWIQQPFHWVSTLQFCWYEGHADFRNFPLWFIPALFNACIFYKAILLVSKDRWIWKFVWVILSAVVAILLSQFNINLPFFWDTALSALPYLLFADCLRTSSVLSKQYNLLRGGGILIVLILCFSAMYVLADFVKEISMIYRLLRYFVAFFGVSFVMMLAKMINHSRFLSFCGKNSLIILGVHLPLTALRPILQNFFSLDFILSLFMFLVLIILSCLASLLLNKLFPQFLGRTPLLNL